MHRMCRMFYGDARSRNSCDSVIRQVPDNQEVFLDPKSDVSIIVEVLQRVSEQTDDGAVR